MYLVRYSKQGLPSNKYYYKYPYNTEKPSIQLPNCTCYSQGAGQESGSNEAMPIGSKALGSFGNAKTWYANSPLDKGKEIKEGCIVVYDGQYGHVLHIEKIIEKISDTHCICRITQSNYREDKSVDNPNYFQTLIYDIEIGVKTKGVGLIPIGCIYPPTNDVRVERDTTKHQIEITYEMMRARDNNMNWIEGMYIPLGIYNVIKKQEKTINGTNYMCAKLDDNCWVALVDGCYNEYLKSTDYKALYEEAQSKLDKIDKVLRGEL